MSLADFGYLGKMNGVVLFNPWSAKNGYRIPNSILQIAASIEGKYNYVIVDGNRERDPWKKIVSYLSSGLYKYFGSTVMPGPQLKQAIPITADIKKHFPEITIIWGGYFPSNQFKTVINSGIVDFIVNGPGDYAFPELLDRLESKKEIGDAPNLIYKQGDEIIRTQKAALADMDALPDLPYRKLNEFYPLQGYLKKTFLGTKTAAYHSSMGCPFSCSFCAVVPIYNARWKGKSAALIYRDVKYLIDQHGADAVEFHDNNFFVSEKRVVDFARVIAKENISWWGEARIDTMDKYSDESLATISASGCKMIFFGAETSNDDLLKKMDKGGTQSTEQILAFARRLKKFGIIPEYSFVLGFPGATPHEVNAQIDRDIAFIKQVKEINPLTEIIIYVYSPVPTEGSEMYETVKATGFKFPETLQDWLSPEWQNFDLRKNPLTPWLTPKMVDKIKGFETVLNAQYPTVSDFRLGTQKRKFMKLLSAVRYKNNLFQFPYELKAFQKIWKYRQPELEGFKME